jgi:formate dehydrogenase subunit delta
MDIHNLVSMANRIGQFFESFSDRDEALEGISNHIQKFWEPRMRRELLAHAEGEAHGSLSPIVLAAVKAHRASIA